MNRREALLGAAALAACSPAASVPAPAPFPMRRGVNLGNALEAPNEGEWGYRIEADHLRAIADAGFDGVRLPVRWDAHAGAASDYRIDPDFFGRVDEVIEQALSHRLMVQLDMHHYDALFGFAGAGAPPTELFLAAWRQIAERYRRAPSMLLFEPMNEPNGRAWTARTLANVQAQVLNVIRETNPERPVAFGPANWNSIDALRDWRPPSDANVIASAHYYEPHNFTHQNASWLGADAPQFGRDWGTRDDRATLAAHIGAAARWSRETGVSLQIGEFGVNSAVPPQQRAAWTRAVREACEAEGLGWCVWDFAGAFPIWDSETRALIPLMRDALFA